MQVALVGEVCADAAAHVPFPADAAGDGAALERAGEADGDAEIPALEDARVAEADGAGGGQAVVGAKEQFLALREDGGAGGAGGVGFLDAADGHVGDFGGQGGLVVSVHPAAFLLRHVS